MRVKPMLQQKQTNITKQDLTKAYCDKLLVLKQGRI